MFAILRKIILIFSLGTIAVIGFVFLCLHNTSVMKASLPPFINLFWQGGEVVSLDVKSQHFQFPAMARLDGVRVLFSQQGLPCVVDGERMEANLKPAKIRGQEWTGPVQWQGLNIKSSLFMVQQLNGNGQVEVRGGSLKNFHGKLQLGSFLFNQFLFLGGEPDVVGDPLKIELTDLTMRFAGGRVTAEISLERAASVRYIMQGQFEDVDLGRLVEDREPLFPDIKGKVSGDFALAGDGADIRELTSSFHLLPGGQVKAAMFQYLLNVIPDSQQRTELQKLIAQGGDVDLDKAEITVSNVGTEKLAWKIQLVSEKYNLDVNLTLDVNVEGGLNTLLANLEQVSTLKEGL